ncbi:MAG: hypothetical protein WBG37_14100 [Desulfobacterales bacterium]
MKKNSGLYAIWLMPVVFIIFVVNASAAEFHNPPRDFLFGNHFDTHQETAFKDKNGGELSGFLYIILTGETDEASGFPIVRHPRGAGMGEECEVDVDCVPGWQIDGTPSEAKFISHGGVNGNDHPIWLVNRAELPYPGGFIHFHWITTASSDYRSSSVPAACNFDTAGELAPDAVDVTCPGWFLQIRAVRNFAFEHGGEIVPVRPGMGTEIATHLNLVSNYKVVESITSTRLRAMGELIG